ADVSNLAFELETAINAPKILQGFADLAWVDIEPYAHSYGGCSIQHVMTSRYAKLEFTERLSAVVYGEMRVVSVGAASVDLAAQDSEIGIIALAISNGSSCQPGQEIAEPVIVIAQHDHAVKRDTIHEVNEGLFHIGHIAVAVHVLAVNVGHHRQDG